MSMIPYNPLAYSFENFHLLMGSAAWEIKCNIQAPDAMIGMAVTAVAAAVVQGLADVRLPTGQLRPTGLNFLVVAGSGERKTTVDNLLFKPLHEHDAAQVRAYHIALDSYQVQIRRWNAKDKTLNTKLDKAEGDAEQEAHWREKIEQHMRVKPSKPRLRRLMRQNLTDRAWMDALEGDGESIILATDEGEVLFKGRAMSQIGRLNKAFDGAPLLSLDLADDEFVVVSNPRVSINIMTQPVVLKEYLDKHGEVARGSGHWARYLVAWPASMQGYRYVHEGDPVWEHLPRYHLRIQELVERYSARVARGDTTREVLVFSDEAKARWVDLARETEDMIRPGGYLSDINDFASKVMEILGRLAAVFHYFNAEEGKINVDTLNRAFEFVRWHVEEFKRMFSDQFVPPQEQADAQRVEDYLQNRAPKQFNNNGAYVRKNLLLNRNVVPSARRLNAALDILEGQNKIRRGSNPRSKERWIYLGPGAFTVL